MFGQIVRGERRRLERRELQQISHLDHSGQFAETQARVGFGQRHQSYFLRPFVQTQGFWQLLLEGAAGIPGELLGLVTQQHQTDHVCIVTRARWASY